MLHNINLLGFLLITVSFLFGIKLPDWDFKLGLRHRNILTHSPFITIIFIALYETKTSYNYTLYYCISNDNSSCRNFDSLAVF